MHWYKYTVKTTTEATDLLSGLLMDRGIEGVEISDNIQLTEAEQEEAITVVLPDLPEDNGEAFVSIYLEDSLSKEEIEEKLNILKDTLTEISEYVDIGEGSISFEDLNEDDYKDNWKEFFHAFRVDEDIVIKPLWEELPEDMEGAKATLVLDPGMAFGTGRHETTQLSMLNIKKYLKGGDSVIDIGTGSGILAILAKKLGASRILGTDIDEPAVDIAVENTIVNNVPSVRIDSVASPSMLSDEKIIYSFSNVFDKNVRDELNSAFSGGANIVVANILADVIIPICGFVKEICHPGGLFISSGIFADKVDDVKKAALDAGLEILEIRTMGDWNSFVCRV